MKNFFHLFLTIILTEHRTIARSLCIRSQSDLSVYETNPRGTKFGRLIGKVSTEVTSQFLLEAVTSNAGHSVITCHQNELDTLVQDYERCVRQIQHQLRCISGGENVCGWHNAFINTCTGEILGRCLTQESISSLQLLQTAVIRNNAGSILQGCDPQESVRQNLLDFARNLDRQESLVASNQKVPSSALLRLG